MSPPLSLPTLTSEEELRMKYKDPSRFLAQTVPKVTTKCESGAAAKQSSQADGDHLLALQLLTRIAIERHPDFYIHQKLVSKGQRRASFSQDVTKRTISFLSSESQERGPCYSLVVGNPLARASGSVYLRGLERQQYYETNYPISPKEAPLYHAEVKYRRLIQHKHCFIDNVFLADNKDLLFLEALVVCLLLWLFLSAPSHNVRPGEDDTYVLCLDSQRGTYEKLGFKEHTRVLGHQTVKFRNGTVTHTASVHLLVLPFAGLHSLLQTRKLIELRDGFWKATVQLPK